MKARGLALTIIGWPIMLGSLYGAWRSRVPWDWLEQGLWTLGILVGAAVTMLGYRHLSPKSDSSR
jgi:hypothetical protein